MLHVDHLELADALRELEISGSEKGGVVNQPLSFSQTTGGFRHSSIVVQIEKFGANS
jgi:hypothetical protein